MISCAIVGSNKSIVHDKGEESFRIPKIDEMKFYIENIANVYTTSRVEYPGKNNAKIKE